MRGVFFNRQNNRWRAALRGYGRNGYIGEFWTEAEAVAARVAAEVQMHGRRHDRPEVQLSDELARIPLPGRGGVVKGWTTIDLADSPLAQEFTWCLSRSGYAVARRGDGLVFLHRLILPGDGVADHINREKLDNRRANLRLCLQRDNARNRAGWRTKPPGLKGVTPTASGKFTAAITVDRRRIYLGLFITSGAAAAAYDRAALEHFGDFAHLNAAEKPGVDVRVEPLAPQVAA